MWRCGVGMSGSVPYLHNHTRAVADSTVILTRLLLLKPSRPDDWRQVSPPHQSRDNMSVIRKPKLELTWIGKENRPRLESRILLEDSEWSCHAKHRVSNKDLFDNRLIFGDNASPFSGTSSRKKRLRSASVFRTGIHNTRAVPLARKGDAHQGRVVLSCASCCVQGCYHDHSLRIQHHISGDNRTAVTLVPNVVRYVTRYGKET